jgi:hypothetical protein
VTTLSSPRISGNTAFALLRLVACSDLDSPQLGTRLGTAELSDGRGASGVEPEPDRGRDAVIRRSLAAKASPWTVRRRRGRRGVQAYRRGRRHPGDRLGAAFDSPGPPNAAWLCGRARHGKRFRAAQGRLYPAGDRAKDAEILALRHQVMVLVRQLHGPKVQFTLADRPSSPPCCTGSARRRAAPERLLVRPETVLLRWHRDLIAPLHPRPVGCAVAPRSRTRRGACSIRPHVPAIRIPLRRESSTGGTTGGKENGMHAVRRTVVVATLLVLLGLVAGLDVAVGVSCLARPDPRRCTSRYPPKPCQPVTLRVVHAGHRPDVPGPCRQGHSRVTGSPQI